MKHSRRSGSACTRIVAAESGQAAMEFALIATLMLVIFSMVIDFSRAIHDVQVMAGLSRQGSNLASRGTSLSDSAAAVIAGDSAMNLNSNGEVIITSVTNINRVLTITDQVSQGNVLLWGVPQPETVRDYTLATRPPKAGAKLRASRETSSGVAFTRWKPPPQ